MEKIGSLVRDLILIVAVTAFLELLLPVGELRRYIRMIMGVLAIVAVTQVWAGFFHQTEVLSWPEITFETLVPKEPPDYGKYQAEYATRVRQVYRQGIARQAGALARLAGLDVGRVEVLLAEDGEEYPVYHVT